MAIRLIDRYPNRANPANTDYPHGSGRNKSSPTAIDGTPFDENRFNDQEGFFQSLLEAAEVAPNNTPDTVPASQYADALSIVANGLIVIDVAGNANATLDFNQKRVHGFRLTGVLTGNIEVIVPDTMRMYTVVNDTTGNFTVTVKTALGTGVVASQGQTFVVRCDGVDVVRGLDSQRTIYVGSVAELEALSPLNGQQFMRKEFWPGTNIGSASLYWDESRPVADHNGGTIIDPAKINDLDTTNKAFGAYFTADTTSGNTGCFVVEYSGDGINPALFGAFVDNVNDDGPALRASANTLNADGGYLDLGGETYRLDSSGISLKSERSSVICGKGATININTTSGDVITVYSGVGGAQIKNPSISGINFVSATTRTGGTTIKLLNTTDALVKDCNFRGQWLSIKTEVFQYGLVHNCTWNVVGRDCIEVAGGSGFTISDCRGIAGPDKVLGTKAVRLKDASGVIISNCDWVRFEYGVYGAPVTGDVCQFIFMSQVLCDSGAWGFFFTATNGGSLSLIHGVECWGSSNDEYNVYAANVQGISFTGGGRFINAGKDGLQFLSCTDVEVSDSFIAWNNLSNASNGSGVLFSGCTRSLLSGNIITNSPNYPGYANTRNQKRAVTYTGANNSPSCINNKFSHHPLPDINRDTNPSDPGPIENNTTDRSNSVASSSNITTELAHDFVRITGTTTIDNIVTPAWDSKEQRLLIVDGCNINNSFNFVLSGNFSASTNPNSILSLRNVLNVGWCETSRSINT